MIQRSRNFTYAHTCVDMHMHSTYSDGLSSIPKIVKKAQKHGFGVSITDHNEILGAIQVQNYDVFSIPGIEISSKEGIHMLLYFYTIEDLKSYYYNHVLPFRIKQNFYILNASMLQLLDAAKQYECIISAAHPFGAGATGMFQRIHAKKADDILKRLDAIEVLNGGILKSANTKAQKFSKISSLSSTAGSDGHSLSEIGKVVVQSPAKTPKDFLNDIKKGNINILGKEFPPALLPATKIKTLHNFTKSPLHYGRHASNLVKKRILASSKAF